MKTFYIDTNAILRFILKDNLAQHSQTKALFEQAQQGRINIILLNEVLVELSYVLTKVYRVEKSKCTEILLTLVESEYITLATNEKAVMIYALNIYAKNNIDIVDSILFAYARMNNHEVFSFDRDYKKIKE